MKKNLFVAIIILFGLTGCEPTIDGSSSEAFNQSLEKIHRSLDGKKKIRFKNAVEAIMTASFFANKKEIKDMRQELDGMTASEFLAKIK